MSKRLAAFSLLLPIALCVSCPFSIQLWVTLLTAKVTLDSSALEFIENTIIYVRRRDKPWIFKSIFVPIQSVIVICKYDRNIAT